MGASLAVLGTYCDHRGLSRDHHGHPGGHLCGVSYAARSVWCNICDAVDVAGSIWFHMRVIRLVMQLMFVTTVGYNMFLICEMINVPQGPTADPSASMAHVRT